MVGVVVIVGAPAAPLGLGGWTNHWKGAVFAGNLFGGASGALRVFMSGEDGDIAEIADGDTWPENVFQNQIYDATFADAGSRTKEGFALAPANTLGVTDALPLTATTTAGTAVTTFTVQDAGYFFDGWTLEYFGEVGDMIRVGDNDPARIRSVDTETATIVVETPVSFSANASVFLVDGDGLTVWSNRGAHQDTR